MTGTHSLPESLPRHVSREHWDTLYKAYRTQTDSWLELYDLLVATRRDLAAQGATSEGLPGVLPQTLFRIAEVLERGQ